MDEEELFKDVSLCFLLPKNLKKDLGVVAKSCKELFDDVFLCDLLILVVALVFGIIALLVLDLEFMLPLRLRLEDACLTDWVDLNGTGLLFCCVLASMFSSFSLISGSDNGSGTSEFLFNFFDNILVIGGIFSMDLFSVGFCPIGKDLDIPSNFTPNSSIPNSFMGDFSEVLFVGSETILLLFNGLIGEYRLATMFSNAKSSNIPSSTLPSSSSSSSSLSSS